MIKYFTIEDLLKHYLQKKFHILEPLKIGVMAIGFKRTN